MRGVSKVGVSALLAMLVCVPVASAQAPRDEDVYARVGSNEVVLGNSVAERRWSRDALPRRVRTGSILVSVNAPGRPPFRRRALPDKDGNFGVRVPEGSSASVIEVRDGCQNTGK